MDYQRKTCATANSHQFDIGLIVYSKEPVWNIFQCGTAMLYAHDNDG